MRSPTLTLVKPSPIGVVTGPLSATLLRRIESMSSSGSGWPVVRRRSRRRRACSQSIATPARVEDADDGLGDFRSDAVAGDQRDGVSHEDRIIIICAVEDSLDWIADTLIASLASGAASPSAVLFVLRSYTASGRADLRDAIEAGLTTGLDQIAAEPIPVVAASGWVCSPKRPRSPTTNGWWRVSACTSRRPSTVSSGSCDRRTNRARGWSVRMLSDQIRSALAFLTAFELTGRLPYSMLAEELLQIARRDAWDRDGAGFGAELPRQRDGRSTVVPPGGPSPRCRLRRERRGGARRDLRARRGAHSHRDSRRSLARTSTTSRSTAWRSSTGFSLRALPN